MRGSAGWVRHASKHPSRRKRRRRFSERCCPGSREVFTATESTPRLARMTTDSAPRPITLWRRTPSMVGAWASDERVVEGMGGVGGWGRCGEEHQEGNDAWGEEEVPRVVEDGWCGTREARREVVRAAKGRVALEICNGLFAQDQVGW